MISHNTSKEAIENNPSWGPAGQIFMSRIFSPIQNSTKFYFVSPRYFVSPDTKLVTVPFPLFCFHINNLESHFESSTGFPKILHANIN